MDYLIGEFSAKTGLGVHTLRYYEGLGILKPNRDPQGRRIYSANDLAWADFIKRLKETGMPVKEIARYSKLRELGESTLQERLEMLHAHKRRVQSHIAALEGELERLNDKITVYEREIEKMDKK